MSSSQKARSVSKDPRCAREGCSEPAIKRGDTGPPRRYCSPACRQAAYRRRRQRPRRPSPVEERDVIGDAVELLDNIYAALPGSVKGTRDGDRLMKLALELHRFHQGTWG